ncbi:MAG TPA: plastocyanin/azurin family copper-binding protein [Symbiobacteriaceae bacterium]|jgi:plastocyanin
MRKWILSGLVTVLLLLTAGCSKPAVQEVKLVRVETPVVAPMPTAAPGEVIWELKGIKFSPALLEVTAGTKITWYNSDPMDHQITEGDFTKQGTYKPLFESPLLGIGKTYSFTFDKPGTYSIYCEVKGHAALGMKAQLTVK